MAKYVMLLFADDKSADTFVENVQRERDAGAYIVEEGTAAHWQPFECDVRAVFKKPTKFCECKNVKKRGFLRGRRYGWWVCSQCGKPTVAWGRGEHWFLALGKNLLPISNTAPEYRGDGIFARHFKPCPECGQTLITALGHGDVKVYCDACDAWR